MMVAGHRDQAPSGPVMVGGLLRAPHVQKSREANHWRFKPLGVFAHDGIQSRIER